MHKFDSVIFNKNQDPEKDFIFQEMLGKGASGVVFKAIHKLTKEKRAVKKIQSKNINRKAFTTEVKLLMELDHPTIIRIHSIYDWKDHFYII